LAPEKQNAEKRDRGRAGEVAYRAFAKLRLPQTIGKRASPDQ